MKSFTSFAKLASLLLILGLASCKPQDEPKPEPEPQDSLPTSFQRKQLIEHFTGEACGYCPAGMEYIENAIKGRESEFVWLSNHAGYADDEFTIADSKKIVRKFGVSGAPTVILNRTRQTYTEEGNSQSSTEFHPYYLAEVAPKAATTTTASIAIAPQLDTNEGIIRVKITGQSIPEDELQVVVALKESGLHGAQADYYNTWEGWADFVHTNVVRAYLTAPLGEAVTLTNHAYALDCAYEWDATWTAANSSVVAFVLNSAGEVLNAEEVPVVEGTDGGKSIHHEGLTAVEVPDTYPEYEEAPAAAQTAVFSQMQYRYAGDLDNGNKVLQIFLISSNTSTYNGATVQPVASIFLILDADAATNELPIGTFTLSETGEAGTAWAGFRDEEEFQIVGSSLYLAYSSYLNQGYLYGSQWMLAAGRVIIGENSISYKATSLNGSALQGAYTKTGNTTPAKNLAPANNNPHNTTLTLTKAFYESPLDFQSGGLLSPFTFHFQQRSGLTSNRN